MEFSKYDVYAYQILHYFVTSYHYQIIRIEQHQEDIWLANPKQEDYPVIRICSKRMEDVEDTIAYLRNVHRNILDLIHREGVLLLLNTCPDCYLLEHPLIRQVRVSPQYISDHMLLKAFPHLHEVAHDVDDPLQEMSMLSRSIEEAQLQQQRRFLRMAKKRMHPSVSLTFMGISIVYSSIVLILQFLCKDAPAAWVAGGAYYKINVVAAHEYWRLLSAGCFHADLFVLMFQLYAFYQIGKLCEPIFTKMQYIALIIGSICCGYLCMLIGDANAIAYGLGSAIWGIAGAYLVNVLETGSYRIPMVRVSLMNVLLLCLFVWLLPGMSILGHIGGLMFGVFMTMAFVKRKNWKTLAYHARIAGTMMLIALSLMGLRVQVCTPIQKELDARIVRVFTHTPLDSYARYLNSCYNKQYRRE